jgi:hypothetical protein
VNVLFSVAVSYFAYLFFAVLRRRNQKRQAMYLRFADACDRDELYHRAYAAECRRLGMFAIANRVEQWAEADARQADQWRARGLWL